VLPDCDPDVHLPWEFRWGEHYDALPGYDAWLRGAELLAHDDEFFEEIFEQGDPGCAAARLNHLLQVLLPSSSLIQPQPAWCFSPLSVDVRRPAAEQLAAFARFGWSSLPQARDLLRLMVTHAEMELDMDQKNNPWKHYAMHKAEYFQGHRSCSTREHGTGQL
jgi:hypothetical protein